MRQIASLLAFATIAIAPALAAQPIPVSRFQSVELRGGGEILIRPGPVQRVTLVRGSTQFTTFRMERDGRLKVDACNSRCPRNYNLRIEIQSPAVPALGISGGGKIVTAAGFAPQAQISAAVSGGGEIDLRPVSARRISAAVNGGGRVLTGRSAALSVSVNGGGEVLYSGNPQLSTAINGGGTVGRNR